ncbi:sensor histidine kinase [Paenibacillus sp. GXUN7292]|uniref:sensor histidine kinase n=1 Tax=Paenibacillus sp. GXUN7292 TaxID=3422499 RepID=UPI003D7EAD31
MKTLPINVWRYIRHYKFNSILLRNFILIMTLINVPMVGISVFVYSHNDADMRAEIERSAQNELAGIRASMDLILSDAEQLSVRMKADPDVLLFLSKKLSSPLSYNDAQTILRIQQMLQTVKLTSSYIDSIFIYSELNDYLLMASSGTAQTDAYYNWQPNMQGGSSASSHYWLAAATEDGQSSLLSFINDASAFRNRPENSGSVSINMNLDSLNALLSSVEKRSIYLLNQEERLVYSPDSGLLNQSLLEADPMLHELLQQDLETYMIKQDGYSQVIAQLPSQTIGNWKYVSVNSLERYHSEQARVIDLTIILLIVSVLASIILAFIIAVRSYSPIRQILSLIENKENPFMLLGKLEDKKRNETEFILRNLTASYHQKQNAEAQLKEKYELLRKAQAIALQAQINPHFLYNTLESINWKVMRLSSGKNEATQMILSLSTLLRLTLETKDDLVPIRKELEHVSLYVELQKLRYKDKFSFEYNVEERLMDCKIVKLVLQPLVENAIYYGIKQSVHHGLITIRVFSHKDHIIVRVRDNGIGIPRSVVQALNDSFDREHLQENEHIGLRNVNQRIRLAFGEPYGLTVRSKLEVGTIVEMKLPKLHAV